MPLLVEAAETLFEPIVIRNNVAGYERDVLKRFEEPEWNNPVVRFIDADAKDVIPRKDRVWQTGPLLGRMSSALETAKNDVPEWLRLVAAETSAGEVDTAVFVMT